VVVANACLAAAELSIRQSVSLLALNHTNPLIRLSRWSVENMSEIQRALLPPCSVEAVSKTHSGFVVSVRMAATVASKTWEKDCQELQARVVPQL
jgi:hypothetical protein